MSAEDTRTVVRIFVASPGDVTAERERLRKVVTAWNQPGALADRLGLTLQLLDWRQVAPDMGRPEGVILEQLPVHSWDIFVGILWLRFGTLTGATDPQTGLAYDSGTHEEFMLAHRAWQETDRPRILFYRCKRDAPLDKIDLEQYGKVQAFWKEFRAEGRHPGLPQEYDTPDGFEERVRSDLEKLLLEHDERMRGKEAERRRRRPVAVPAMPAADAAQLEETYLRRVMVSCNALPLAIIDPQAAERTRQRTMELLAVYVAVDTETRTLLPAEALATIAELRAAIGEVSPAGAGVSAASTERHTSMRLTALETVARERQMVLLGGPGSGKSTFINYLALCLAGARLEQAGKATALASTGWLDHLQPAWSHGPLLPLQITLRHFGQSEWCDGTAAGLWNFVAQTLAAQGLADFAPHLRQRLLDGGVLLLLDGLDEVADPEQRKAVLEAVTDFATTYGHPANRTLVTCRGYAYRDPCWQLEGFADHTLAPFSQKQIDAFINCWYKEVCRLGWKSQAEAEDLTRRLQTATRRADLAPLAGSPLQLTMMASLHFSWGRLPEDRVELYQEMVRLLLVRWQEARLGEEVGVTQAVSTSKLESALERVAFEAHHAQGEGEGTADISEETLRRVLKDYLEGSWDRAGELLAYIQQRAGLLLERGTGVYTLPHRSYQEYLAGAYLAVQPDFPDEAAALIAENSAQWREVVLWAVGVMARLKKMTHVAVDVAAALCPGEAPTGAVAEAAWRAAQLAGEALLEIGVEEVQARERHQEVLARVQRWLVALLRTGALQARERAEAGNVLGRLGDPRFRTDAWYLPDEPLLGFVEVPGGPFIMGEDHEQHEVDLPAFYVARYPVTVAQFRAFVEDSGYRPTEPDNLQKMSNHPMVWVTWYEALEYCQWLTEQLREWEGTPEPLATLLREERWAVTLPSEAQWEKAARGTDGRRYPWGENAEPDKANYVDTGIGTTTAVGSFPAGVTPYGLLDMAGNVWEWCSSLWGRDWEPELGYPYEPTDGRESLEAPDDVRRVVRGGSWDFHRYDARCACRSSDLPVTRDINIGFRVCVVSRQD